MNKVSGAVGAMGLAAFLLAGYVLVPKTQVQPVGNATLDPVFVAAEGKIETLPGHKVQVGSELTGRIEKVFVNEGDWVKKGQLIAKLESKDILARLNDAEAQRTVAKAKLDEVASGSRVEEIEAAAASHRAASAELDLAKANFERYQELNKEGVIPTASFEEKQRELEVARDNLQVVEQKKILLEKGPKRETITLQETGVQEAAAAKQYLEKLLEKTVVTAPISGKIIQKYLHDGEVVYTQSPQPFVTIADTERIRISAEVDETDIGRIHIGDAVEIRSDAYPGVTFRGEVQEIADYVGSRQIMPNNPAKNLDMKVVQAKISLPPGSPLKLGMTVDVRIIPKGS